MFSGVLGAVLTRTHTHRRAHTETCARAHTRGWAVRKERGGSREDTEPVAKLELDALNKTSRWGLTPHW